MSFSVGTEEIEEKKVLRKNLLKKVENIKFILEILEGEIKTTSYDKISDSISALNTSISVFLNELKKL